MFQIYLIYLLFLILLFLILIFFGAFWRAPWIPTKKEDYDRIAKLANLGPKMFFYDLGSGTGDMLFYLSKKYNINCAGIEVSPLLYFYSKIRSLFYKKVKIYYGNFFQHDLSRADVVYVFLHPKLYDRLKKRINSGLKNDSKIILAGWPFEKSNPIRISKEKYRATYYLYKKPL